MPSFPTRAAVRHATATTVPALRALFHAALLLAALTLAGAAHAATDSFNGGAVANCSYVGASQTYTCSSLSNSKDIAIANGYTVIVTGSAAINSQQKFGLDGSLQVTGAFSLDTTSVSGSGNIAVTGAASISTGNNSTLYANIQAGTLTLGNQTTVVGIVTVSGDVDIGNHAIIDGSLTAHNVVMEQSFAEITGNATVNALNIGTKGKVDGVITCTGAGASGCSCVTYNHHSTAAPVCSGGQAAGIDHILITHGATGLTCQPQTVTISACANAACTSLYTGTTNVTLTPGGQTFVVSGGVNNNATVQQTTPGTVDLDADSVDAANPTTCHDTLHNSTSCTMTFSDAGFAFNIPDHVAESSQQFTIKALQLDASGNTTGTSPTCKPLLTTSQNINFICEYLNPSSGTQPVRIYNGSIASPIACNAGGVSVSVPVPFQADGTATLTLQYADAGLMKVKATYPPTSGTYAGLTLNGSDSFIAAPDRFRFTFSKTVSGTTSNNPAASDAAGAAFIGAGQPFQGKLEAVNVAGNVTANFGNETPAETYTLAPPTLVAPVGGQLPAVSPMPAANTEFNTMKNGTTALASMQWDEVGIINFKATLNNAAGYLNAGTAFVTTGNVNVGRFIPDHFDTLLNGTAPMSCPPASPVAASPCPPLNASGKFVYARQPFGLTVTARTTSGALTQNYAGAFAKNVALSAFNGVGASGAANQNPPNPPGGNSLVSTGIPASLFALGTATTDTASMPAYAFANSYPAASALLSPPTNIWLRATDADNATSLRGPATSEALVSVVSGRLQVSNNYGSETSPMPVPIRAQYWTGSGWVNNPYYSNATPVPLAGKVSYSNCQKNLAVGGGCIAFTLLNGNLSFVNGVGRFTLGAPGSGHNGSVDVALGVGAGSAIVFLPSTAGRLTFGVYRAGPVVYLREVY